MRARLRQPATPPAPRTLSVGPLTLDLVRRVAQIAGAASPVSLSEREYVLLLHLMRRAGEVCNRGELLSEVWGYSFDPGSNIVDVYIGRLRAKLGPQLIETVRNVGYQLQAA
jgi:two-component system OmpR family response regulator